MRKLLRKIGIDLLCFIFMIAAFCPDAIARHIKQPIGQTLEQPKNQQKEQSKTQQIDQPKAQQIDQPKAQPKAQLMDKQLEMIKRVPISDKVLRSEAYLNGNKYQKDAILFVEMLAETHPYYIIGKRREMLYSRVDSLLVKCGSCTTDTLFVSLLREAMPEVRDKHTDVIDLKSYLENRATAKGGTSGKTGSGSNVGRESVGGETIVSTSGKTGSGSKRNTSSGNSASGAGLAQGTSSSPLNREDALFCYRIFEEESICYLQFNQCADSRILRYASLPRFDTFLEGMFDEINKRNIATLIVDLQYNSGGSSRLCDELIGKIRPLESLKDYKSFIRFSPLMAEYNPKAAEALKVWESAGHKDELYPVPQRKKSPTGKNTGLALPDSTASKPASAAKPTTAANPASGANHASASNPASDAKPAAPLFNGNVLFIQGPKTFSSAGILITMARDNGIGRVVGSESTYSPSHYGEVMPFILPNTKIIGSVCSKYFERPDESVADEKSLLPDLFIDLSRRDSAWRIIKSLYSRKNK